MKHCNELKKIVTLLMAVLFLVQGTSLFSQTLTPEKVKAAVAKEAVCSLFTPENTGLPLFHPRWMQPETVLKPSLLSCMWLKNWRKSFSHSAKIIKDDIATRVM